MRYSSRPADKPASSISSRSAVSSGASSGCRACRRGLPIRSDPTVRGTGERRPRSGHRLRTATARHQPRRASGANHPFGRWLEAVGVLERGNGDVPDVPLVYQSIAEVTKRRRPAHATDELASSTTNRCGARDSRRASAAYTSSRNSGCGRSGRLLNSGWAWVPTQNG